MHPTRPRVALLALFVPLALAVGACSEDEPTPLVTAPTTAAVVETFSGTITKNGAVTHTFTSGSAGTVQATLTSLAPDASNPIGVSLGTWNGATCAIVLANDRAIQASVVTGTVSSVGALCARVYDVGNLSAPATYELIITHP